MKRILIATKNRHKIREYEEMFGHAIRFETLPDDAPEVVEDGATFRENALKKAREYSRYSHLPTIAEDSGLEVDALNGEPGVFSARYAGPDADTPANNRLLLERLAGVPESRRTARFVCCLVYVEAGEEKVFEGVVRGRIAMAPAGGSGFGYDPLFIPDGHRRTFAQMSPDEKNAMSHRFRALSQLSELLKSRSL